MTTQQKPASINLAYLLVASPVPNLYIGGLMVTDRYGLPLEFRYTEPIQPTKIQQVLYGQVLNAYIKRDVILETLLKNMEVPFKALLVEDEAMLEHTAKNYAVVRVAVTKTPPIGAVGKRQELGPGELLLQVSAESNPLRLTLPATTPNTGSTMMPSTTSQPPPDAQDLSEEPTIRSKPDLTSLLLDAGQTMDLAEPLRRVEKALEIICHEEGITTNPTARSAST